jgi:5-methylcytosine-specific restriction protein A
MGPVREPQQRRNAPWTRDELILALDLYMCHRPTLLDDRHSEVVELSDLLAQLATLDGRVSSGSRFRNPNGVGMKLGNLARFDHASGSRRGLAHGGKGDEEVWRDFAGDPAALHATATAIRTAVVAGVALPPRSDGRTTVRSRRARDAC